MLRRKSTFFFAITGRMDGKINSFLAEYATKKWVGGDSEGRLCGTASLCGPEGSGTVFGLTQ
jgi:hypothetical protein